MISSLAPIATVIVFVGSLYAVARFAEQNANANQKKDASAGERKWQSLVYSLSLGVYCTTWSFFGAFGAAVDTGASFLAIYLGPALAMVFGAPLILRLVRTSKRQNTTSIADFIASRYGKSQPLAVIVTLISIVAVLPFIASQLKALTAGYSLLTTSTPLPANTEQLTSTQPTTEIAPLSGIESSMLLDPALYLMIIVGLFTVLFGVRKIDANDQQQGMIYAVAFQSLLKLAALLGVGFYVTLFLFDGWDDIFSQLSTASNKEQFWPGSMSTLAFVTYSLLSAFAIFCLPSQFHVAVVGSREAKDIYVARWVFPLYLAAMAIFVIPVAAAGVLVFSADAFSPDQFLLAIPLSTGSASLALLAFTGSVAAAMAMMMVATITLSTMLSNEIISPLLLRIRTLDLSHRRNVKLWLLNTRRATVFFILMAAYWLYRVTGPELAFTPAGLLAFAALVQFAPSLLGGFMWRNGNRQGAIAGMVAGFGVWVYTILLPSVMHMNQTESTLLELGPAGIFWLRPTELLGVQGLDLITHGALWSLAINILLYVTVSKMTTQRVAEKIQVASFLDRSNQPEETPGTWLAATTVDDIRVLTERFLGSKKTAETLQAFAERHKVELQPRKTASPDLIKHMEKQLASAIGSSTARAVLNSALKGQHMQIEDVVSIVDEASEVIRFNRELLQAAIENMSLGVSVVDNNLKVVAWNSRYVEIFNYPKGFLKMGRPMADLLRYNLLMNHVPARRAQQIAEDRLELMQEGKAHEYERMRPDGSVILIQGSPMPGGGFVTTFSDISAMRRTELALKETNTYLEERVKERTEELSKLNDQLANAKSVAEQANLSKTRFLASASHDLLQPLNAARLFTSALSGKVKNQDENYDLVNHIDSSLSAAEEILSTLLDMSKLDAGAYEPHYTVFNISELLGNLNTDFSVIAEDHNLELRTVVSNATVCSDHQLLRRVIQNFLSNAIRYTKEGRILLGCRKRRGKLRIEVWDTGLGIPEAQLLSIFEEFKRLNHGEPENKGLGLGLAIVDRICKMLNYELEVKSTPGKGSMFSITLPMLDVEQPAPTPQLDNPVKRPPRSVVSLQGAEVFCIDNEPSILEGMRALLEGWGCLVHTGVTPEQAEKICVAHPPEIILADYQLDEGKNGLDTMDMLRYRLGRKVPGILVTALNTDEVKEDARNRDYQILHKPLKPAALRAMINKVLSKS